MSNKNRDRRATNAAVARAAADPDAGRPTNGHFCPTCRCAFPLSSPSIVEMAENNHRLAAEVARSRRVQADVVRLLQRVVEGDRAGAWVPRILRVLGPELANRWHPGRR